ncbi:MAG: SRPBCC family protein [Actinobacteria bacterium]|nr:SRPBCC family protein [Actinomycetota bacterium]
MLIENSFHVALPIDEAWAVLSDLPRIAPCMPGAELTEVDGDDHHGIVKVKVGSINTQYRGTATIQQADAAAHRLVVEARGHETRGQGRANATITAELTPEGDGTTVAVVTELQISGRVAQFGRGVLQDVSSKLVEQFVDELQQEVAGAPQAAPSDTATTEEPADATADSTPISRSPAPIPARAPAEPVDLLALGGSSVVRRAAPLVAGLAALIAVIVLLRRRGNQ